MTEQTKPAPRILRRPEVETKTGLGTSALYKRVKDGLFPAPIRLGSGARSVGWVEADVNAWIEEQISRSRVAAQ